MSRAILEETILGRIRVAITAEYSVTESMLKSTGAKTIFEYAELEAKNIREGGEIVELICSGLADVSEEYLQVVEVDGIKHSNQPKHSTALDPSVFGVLTPSPELPTDWEEYERKITSVLGKEKK